MLKINVEKEQFNPLCEQGDLFIVDKGKDAYMVVAINYNDNRLISLRDGNRFDEDNIYGINVNNILQKLTDIDQYDDAFYVKSGRYDVIVDGIN